MSMTIPEYDSQQVSPTIRTGKNIFVGAPQSREQMAQVSRDIKTAGNFAEGVQNNIDQVRVQDAMNKLAQRKQDLTFNPEKGYLSQKGLTALDRPSGKPLAEEYGDDFKKSVEEIAGTLGNETQRSTFMQHAQQAETQFRGNVEQHTLSEFQNYHLNVADDAIKLNSNDAVQLGSAGDIEGMNKKILSAKAAAWQIGQVTGKPMEATMQKVESGILHDTALNILENNGPMDADTFYNQHKDAMTADDKLSVQLHVNRKMVQQVGQDATNNAARLNAPYISPTQTDRLVNFTQGSLTKEGYVKIGEQSKKYDSDVNAVIGANTLGEAKVDAAIDAAKKDGTKPWQMFLSPEDRVALNKVVGNFNAGGGRPEFPTEAKFVKDAVATASRTGDPEAVRSAEEQARRQYAVLLNSHRMEGENAVTTAQQAIAANGLTWDQLPQSMKDNVIKNAPDKVDDIKGYSTRVNSPDAVKTDPALLSDLYLHPDKWNAATDSERADMASRMSPADLKRVIGLATSHDASIETMDRSFNSALNNNLKQLHIPTTFGKGDTAAAARYADIQNFAQDYIYQQQQATGHKFKQEEVKKALDTLFSKDVTFRGMLFGTHSEPLMKVTYGDIPRATRESIKLQLQNGGVNNPTQTQILNAWRRAKLNGQ